jgi:hypothetical protein
VALPRSAVDPAVRMALALIKKSGQVVLVFHKILVALYKMKHVLSICLKKWWQDILGKKRLKGGFYLTKFRLMI